MQPELATSPLLVSPAFRAEEEPHEPHRERTLLTTSYSAAPAEYSWREPPVTERNRRAGVLGKAPPRLMSNGDGL
jgi:hypothetical protein